MFILVGFTLYSGTLFGGGAVGAAYRFWPETILILLLGNLLLGTYAALLGHIAAKTGLSTVLMARYGFGNVGSRLVDFIFGFTQIGWYAWGTALIVRLLNTLAGVPDSYNVWLMIFLTFAFCSTAYIGYRGLDCLSRLAVPAMFILVAWSIGIGLRKVGGFDGLQSILPQAELPIGTAVTIIVGTFISGGTQSANWSRYARSSKAAVWGTLLAFLVGNGLLSLTGAFGASVYGTHDIVEVMAQQGLLFWGLVLLMLNMWTTQDNTIYNFSVAGSNMFRSEKRHAFVIGGAAMSFFLAWWGIYRYLLDFMVLLGTFIPPIGGIIMADYWMKHRSSYPGLNEYTTDFNWNGLISYGTASAVAYWGPGIKPLNGVLVAFCFYSLMTWWCKKTLKVPPDKGYCDER